MPETLCLSYRQVLGPPSRRTTVSNRGTLRISRIWSLLRRRVLIGQQWFWAVWVVLSILPWVFSPFVVRDRFFSAFRVDYICVCTRATHGHRSSVTGGSDPTELWAAESRQKRGRSRQIRPFLRGDFRRGGRWKHFRMNCLGRASGEEVGNSESAESNSYCLHLIHLPPSPISSGIRLGTRARQRRKLCWAGATATVSVATKWGRSSPTRCFARVQNPSSRHAQPRVSQQLPFTVGVNGTVSPTVNRVSHFAVHPSTPEETIKIRCHRHPSTTKEASKTEKRKREFWP